MFDGIVSFVVWLTAGTIAGAGMVSHVSTAFLVPSSSAGVMSNVPAAEAKAKGVIFLGDVLLARDVEARQRRYGLQHPFARISFPSNHVVVGNFESTIPKSHSMTPHLQMRFSSPTSSVKVLNEAGVTHVSLANNHAYDFGADTFLHTRTQLSAGAVQPFGHPNTAGTSSIAYVTVADKKIAIVALNFVSYTPNSTTITDVFALATAHSDLQVAYVHWGPEYRLTAHETQQAQAKMLVAAGADLIIGHHPHVVQNIEYVDEVLVVYSLGNFIFDQYFSRDVQEGLAVLYDPHLDTVQLLPVTSIDSRTQPRYQNEADRQRFLRELANQSAPLIQADIAAGMLPRIHHVATSTKTAMISL